MPNLRGRKDQEREQERSGSDCEAESDGEFNFGSTEEAEGRSAEETKADIGAATEGKSRSQPNKGYMKPRRARRPRPRHGLMWLRALRQKTNWRQPIRTRAGADRRQPIWSNNSIRTSQIT